MNSKLYKFRNVGFQFVRGFRKWEFRVVTNQNRSDALVQTCPGGLKTAEKVARQVSASWKRSKSVNDGLARTAINRLVRPTVED